MRILSMYRIKAIPHGRWFVLHLYTSCFCNRNLTGSMVRCVSSPRSLFRFLINEQFLCINTQYLIKFSITLWSVSSLCTLQIRCHSIYVIVRPLPSFKNPHFQNAPKCTTFLMKMSFICIRMKNHFHFKGWVLNLVLIQRPGETRKWPIANIWYWLSFSPLSRAGSRHVNQPRSQGVRVGENSGNELKYKYSPNLS